MAKRKKSKKSAKKTAAARADKSAKSTKSSKSAKSKKAAKTKPEAKGAKAEEPEPEAKSKEAATEPAPEAKSNRAAEPKAEPAAVAVHVLGTDDARYPMYRLDTLSESGAKLCGGLLHEMAEEFALELAFADESTMRLRARVVDVARDRAPGVEVEFVGVSGEQRGELRRRLGN